MCKADNHYSGAVSFLFFFLITSPLASQEVLSYLVYVVSAHYVGK